MSSHVKAAAPKVKGKVSFKAQNRERVASGSNAGVVRKRQAPPSDDENEDDEDENEEDVSEEADVESEGDTDDEIAAAQDGKSKKTAKRKRRATSPSTFGAALEGLLGKGDDKEGDQRNKSVASHKGQSTILSLAPHIRRSAQSSRLNAKASRLATDAKKKREERARVTDVIGGWGAPGQLPKTEEGTEKELEEESEQVQEWLLQGGAQGYEKRLRKVAQRGVVKLFNAIRAAQTTTESDVEQAKGTKKEENGKLASSNSLKGENALGAKGKAVHELSKNNFFDLIRSGNKAAAH